MIIFDLACEHNHFFEGWFGSPANFDSQLERGLIACPNCASTEIRRIPSVVHVGKSEKTEASEKSNNAEHSESHESISPVKTLPEKSPKISMHVVDSPAAAMAAMQELISIITTQSEDVGGSFAQEARKIHYAEAPARAIRGEVSAGEFDELQDEGIDVLLLPRVKMSTLM